MARSWRTDRPSGGVDQGGGGAERERAAVTVIRRAETPGVGTLVVPSAVRTWGPMQS